MRIEELDKNMKVETSIQKDNIIWLSPKEEPFSIHGLCEPKKDMPYHRIPVEIAKEVSDGVNALNWHTAGGRIRFATNSSFICIKAIMPATGTMYHITKMGQSGFDLYRCVNGCHSYVGSFSTPEGITQGYEACRDTGMTELCTYTINMPLYDGVTELFIGLDAGCIVEKAQPYTYPVPVLYYGSSITQGGCASRPGNSYQGFIERKYDTDYINLGFSGNARAEKQMAEYLASLEASIFVCDYDHNAPNIEHLQATHYPLYQTYRKANPKTPIVFVSKPDFSAANGSAIRREIIHSTYTNAKDAGDDNVYFIDGETLFAGEFRDSCTVDGVHPNDLGFFRMGTVIGETVGQILKHVSK